MNLHVSEEGIKDDIHCELLCLSIKIPSWFLLHIHTYIHTYVAVEV